MWKICSFLSIYAFGRRKTCLWRCRANLLLQGLLWLVGFPVQARASRSIVVPGIGYIWRLLEIHHAAAFAR